MQYKIECGHEDGRKIPMSQTISDHHPLTFEDVVNLLRAAHGANFQELASIQYRLNQGVEGIVCPRAIDGPVAEASRDTDSVFMAWVRSKMIEDENLVAKRLLKVMKVWARCAPGEERLTMVKVKQQGYFVRVSGVGPWVEVTKEKYIHLEQAAGFRPKVPGEVACGSFGNGYIDGRTGYPQVYVEGSYSDTTPALYEDAKDVITLAQGAPGRK